MREVEVLTTTTNAVIEKLEEKVRQLSASCMVEVGTGSGLGSGVPTVVHACL